MSDYSKSWIIEPVEGSHDLMMIDTEAPTPSRIRVGGPVRHDELVRIMNMNDPDVAEEETP